MRTVLYLVISFIISFLLESIIFLNSDFNFLLPLFIIPSVIILGYLLNNKIVYVLLVIVIGLLYDFKMDIFLFNTFFALGCGYFILVYKDRFNFGKLLLFLIISLVLYGIFYNLIGYVIFKNTINIRSILNILPINIVYFIFCYFTLINSRKLFDL